MEAQTFFDHVLADEGYTCIWCKNGKSIKQLFFTSKQAAIANALELDAEGYDTYFACAKFNSNEERTAVNAKYFKTLWLDIDCGEKKFAEGKGYRTKGDATQALKEFCKAHSLKAPTIVDSGNGLHCYWVFDTTLSYNEWRPLADALKKLCLKHKFLVDIGVVADAARILRIPSTHNYKDKNTTKEVTVQHVGKTHTLSELQGVLLGANQPSSIFGQAVGTLDETTKALFNGKHTKCKFSKIMKLSATGRGCPQLLFCYTHQNEVDHNLWFDMLSIAQRCEDRDKAIHLMSNQNDEYEHSYTEFKANETGGPHLCSTFEASNPSGCDSCIHRGKISTPLLLGRFVEEATPEDNIVNVTHKGLNMPVVDVIPPFPSPYYRRKEGGVMLRSPLGGDEDAVEEDKLIYEHDLYVEKRLRDPDEGEMVVVKHILPNDGLEEFTVPLSSVMSRDKAQTVLAARGVAVPIKQVEPIVNYIIKCVQELQKETLAEIARAQFGWQDKDTTFIVGTRQITADTITYSPPSSATRNVVDRYQPKGSLENWVEIANLYGRPGQEARAFILGLGFGSPLLKFSGVSGFIVHITNQGSGQGKTTSQFMVNSIWGHPKRSILLVKDKELARQNHFGTLQHLPSTVDEMTNLTPEQASDMALMITDGRGRDRMMAQSNSVRKNDTTWQAPCITSGNSSLHALLLKNKNFPEGELLRVLEIKLEQDDTLTKKEADKYFGDDLFENYGLACEPLMRHVIENLQDCKDLFFETRESFDTRVAFEHKHRFYSNACATAFTGLELAKTLGLIDIDVERVKTWAANTLFSTMNTIKEANVGETEILHEYVSQHIDAAIVVNGAIKNNLQAAAQMQPRSKILLRYEPDTGLLFISLAAFNNWCVDKQICTKTLMANLTTQGAYAGRKTARLTSGTSLPPVVVRCYVFNYTTAELAEAA